MMDSGHTSQEDSGKPWEDLFLEFLGPSDFSDHLRCTKRGRFELFHIPNMTPPKVQTPKMRPWNQVGRQNFPGTRSPSAAI